MHKISLRCGTHCSGAMPKSLQQQNGRNHNKVSMEVSVTFMWISSTPVHVKLGSAAVHRAIGRNQVSDAASFLHALIPKGMTPKGAKTKQQCLGQLTSL